MALINYSNEYGRLRRVVLYMPRISELAQDNAKDAMYISLPDPAMVRVEVNAIARKFKDMGIDVILLEDTSDTLPPCPNMVFLRDVAIVIDNQIILSKMKHSVRRPEPQKLKSLLIKYNAAFEQHIIDPLSSNYSLEGADVLVMNRGQLIGYAEHRSHPHALQELSKITHHTIELMPANIRGVPQHLLGAMHILSSNLLARRPALCPSGIPGFSNLDFVETDEVRRKFSLNIVTIAPNEVLMPADCPKTQSIFESAGITCHTVAISEINKMGGGLACMTLPLEREQQ